MCRHRIREFIGSHGSREVEEWLPRWTRDLFHCDLLASTIYTRKSTFRQFRSFDLIEQQRKLELILPPLERRESIAERYAVFYVQEIMPSDNFQQSRSSVLAISWTSCCSVDSLKGRQAQN
jgi:hypothetical protein